MRSVRWAAIRAQVLIGEADAGLEGLCYACGDIGSHRGAEGPGGKGEAVFFVGENEGARRAELESIAVGKLEKARRRLTAQPFQQPALLEVRQRGELRRGHGACAVECAVQSKLIAQVDHQ